MSAEAATTQLRPDIHAAFAERARRVLLPGPMDKEAEKAWFGCHAIAGMPHDPDLIARAKPAAVLYPVLARPEGLSVLLTERAGHLASHAGQVAFPGGRIEPGEAAGAAALREAEEEVGLPTGHVEPLGFLPPYYSGTGYRVDTLIGLVSPDFALRPAPDEVARVFEVPLTMALDLARYRRGSIFWRGRERSFFILDHEAAYIWGVTAGIMRSFAERY